MGLDPVSLIISAALAIGSAAIQQRQRRRARRAARAAFEANAGVDLRFTPSAQPVPICYGYTGAVGIQVYAQTSRELPSVPTGSAWGTLASTSSPEKFRSFLLTQNVLCAAGIEELVDLHIDEKPYTSEAIQPIVAHEFHQEQASGMATNFTTERSADDTFTGLAAITGAYKYDIDDPVFGAPPYLFAFLQGQKIKEVTAQNTLSAAKTFSTNAVRVLLDYLVNDAYGPGLTEDDIDLPSFRVAQMQADCVEQGPGLVDRAFLANQTLGTNFMTVSEYLESLDIMAGDNGIGAFHGEATRPLGRYECHGNLPTTRQWPDVIDQILEVMPGVQFWRGHEGKYKIKLPRIDMSETDQAVTTINEEDLYEPVTRVWPDSQSKLNRMTARYANVRLDLAQDTFVWPPAGSTAEMNLRTADGNVTLHDDTVLELTNNQYHAASILSNTVVISRRPTYRFKMRPRGFLLEPGDIVRLVDTAAGIDDFVMIETVTVNQNLEIDVGALQFRRGDYEWISDTKNDIPARSQDVLNTPAAPLITLTLREGVPRFLDAAWTVPDTDAPVESSRLELAKFDTQPDADTARDWQHVVTSPFPVTSHPIPISSAAAWYIARVQVVDTRGVASPWLESVVTAVPEQDALHGIVDPVSMNTPPKPIGLHVLCAFENCIMDWVNPWRLYSNHGLTRVYRHTSNDLSMAVEVGTADYVVFVDGTVTLNTEYYYWIRFESDTGVLGPASDPSSDRTALNVEGIHDAILADLRRSPLAAALTTPVTSPGFITEELRRVSEVVAYVLSTGDQKLNTDIEAVDQRVTNLMSSLSDYATATALQALTTRVTNAEGVNTAQATAITNLMSSLSDYATATALQALTTRVTNAEGVNTAQATAITNLMTEVEGLPSASAIQTLETRVGLVEDVDGNTMLGTLARWLVKTQVGQLVGGVGLLNNGGDVEFIVNADKFRVIRPGTLSGGRVPFAVEGSVVYLDSAAIRTASIVNAKIANLAVDNAKIANAAVGTLKVQNDAISNNYAASGSTTSQNTTTHRTLASVSVTGAAGYKFVAIATFSGNTGRSDQGSCQTAIYQGSSVLTSGSMIIDNFSAQATGQGQTLVARGTLSSTQTFSARMNVRNLDSGQSATLRGNIVVFVTKR